MLNTTNKEQIQLENVRGGLLRFSGIDSDGSDRDTEAVPPSESNDTEDFLATINTQDYF